MTHVHWLARALLFGFLWVFLVGFAYLLFDSFGIWQKLPEGLTRAIEMITGLVLLGELLGHLALASGRLPEHRSAD